MRLNRYVVIGGILISALVGYVISIVFYPTMFDPKSDVGECKGKQYPKISYVITQVGELDIKNPAFTIFEYDIDPTTLQETGAARNPYPLDPYVPGHPKTKLDMNLHLTDIGTDKRYRIRLKFKLEDSTIIFHKSDDPKLNLSITSVDKNKDMFCWVSSNQKEAVVEVDYYDKGNGNKADYGSFNMNLDVPDKSTPLMHILPISLDPEVRNHG